LRGHGRAPTRSSDDERRAAASGWWFAVRAFFQHQLYYLYGSLVYLFCWIEDRLRRLTLR
jgi:hypothetical protein